MHPRSRVVRAVLWLAMSAAATPCAAQPFAYLLGDAGFDIVNAATGNVHSFVALNDSGSAPTRNFAVSPDGTRVYVTNAAGELLEVDPAKRAILRRLSIAGANGVAVSPDGARVYVSQTTVGVVSVIDVRTFAAVATIPMPVGRPETIIASPDGAFIYVYVEHCRTVVTPIIFESCRGLVFRVAAASHSIVDVVVEISWQSSKQMALSRNGTKLVVARQRGISIVDLPTNSVAAADLPCRILNCHAMAVAISSDGSRAYASSTPEVHTHTSHVWEFDVGTNAVTGSFLHQKDKGSMTALAVSADGTELYALGSYDPARPDLHSERVFRVIDVASRRELRATRTMARTLEIVYAQTPCIYEVFPRRARFTADGGLFTLTVPAGKTCAWTVTRDENAIAAAWVRYEGPISGSGPATMSIRVLPSAVPHHATFVVAGQTVTIDQTLPFMFVDVRPGSVVEQPSLIQGWAVQLDDYPNAGDSGVAAIHVWAYPADGAAPVFVAALAESSRQPRPDIAALFGDRYLRGGFALTVRGLRPGPYTLVFYAQGARTGTFDNVFVLPLTVAQTSKVVVLDGMRADTPRSQPFMLTGWAYDATAPASPWAGSSSTGVDKVHVWAWPVSGAPPTFVGEANYRLWREDVALAYGTDYGSSGFSIAIDNLAPGRYHIVAYARSMRTWAFDAWELVTVDVGPVQQTALFVDAPSPWIVQSGASQTLSGWGIDFRDSGSTCGFDVVHVWAYPAAGGEPLFFGWDGVYRYRSETWAAFGRACGFLVEPVDPLPAGTYTLVAFAHSRFSESFDTVRVTPMIVR